ncbi:uncharacterized protein LOC117656147 isoform X3 [Pantherophis guttatus]|uniref:Uncharacterized protein LOC117656147 isoform X3 n=1 Tax=Pantherophis guttatus TaxID=94885 RepID=A0ABM3YU12_PANGU|nr:uncharacterized protein LOC117656147 isoform X3 [Pantherophis guttatus]
MGLSWSKRSENTNNEIPSIPPISPLGELLTQWTEDWLKVYTKQLDKVAMINYCTRVWPKFILIKPNYRWSKFGESDPYWINALKKVLEGKKLISQLPYVEPWFHVQWFDPFPPRDSRVLYGEEEEETRWDPLAYATCPPLPPPYNPNAAGAVVGLAGAAAARSSGGVPSTVRQYQQIKRESEEVPTPVRPPSPRKTRLQTKKMLPLREMPNGLTGAGLPVTTFVNVPLTSSDLRNYKSNMPSLQADPIKLSESLDLFLGPNLYTYAELQHILGYLFSPEERSQIRKAAMAYWDKTQVGAAQPVAAETKFPLADPGWNNNNAADRGQMEDLKRIILQGVKTAVPQGKNLTKAFEVEQLRDETPSVFLERIKDNLNKYSGLSPETPAYESLMKMQFVTKAWPDIKKKIQKIDDWAGSDITALLKEAQKVYVNRDETKTRQKSQMMVSVMKAANKPADRKEVVGRGRNFGKNPSTVLKQRPGIGRGFPQLRRPGISGQESRKCFACGKEGHFARNCPEKRRSQRMEPRLYTLMGEEDD